MMGEGKNANSNRMEIEIRRNSQNGTNLRCIEIKRRKKLHSKLGLQNFQFYFFFFPCVLYSINGMHWTPQRILEISMLLFEMNCEYAGDIQLN